MMMGWDLRQDCINKGSVGVISALAGCLLLVPTGAQAQADAVVTPSQKPSTAAPAQAISTPPAGQDTLEEIVITAEKREESAQRAPLALSVVSGEQLASQGVYQPEDLNKMVPGLTMTNAATTQIYVRGVGENVGNALGQSAVAVNTDGVYVGRVTAVTGNFFDLQRVEVLKGPQGTLYGRNATGGAINIVSNKPTDEFGGDVQVEVGDYNLRRFTGALNLPATDELSFRFAFYDSKRDGYLNDGRDDEDVLAERLHALYKPNSDVTVLATVEMSRIQGLGDGFAFLEHGVQGEQIGGPLANAIHTQYAIIPTATQGDIPIPALDSGQHFNNVGARVQLDWKFDFATLTFIPGWKKQTFDYSQAETNGSIETEGYSNQYSYEARLANQNDKIKWAGGLYYFQEDVDFDYHGQYVFFSLPQAGIFSTVTNNFEVPTFGTKSYAAFGETTYSFTDSFRGIAGIRFTRETREEDLRTQWFGASYDIPGHSIPSVDPVSGLPTSEYFYNNNESLTFDSTTGKIGFEYDLAPKSLLYGTVSTGFKSGGFSLAPPPQATFSPEKLLAYTLGVKNRLFDDKLQLNAELYWWDYTNQQISHQAPDINGAQGFITENAGKSKIDGIDLDALWAPTGHDRIGLQIQYEDAYFKDYNVTTGFGAPAIPDGCTYTPTTVFGRAAFYQNCSGLRLPYTPTFSGNGGYTHTFDLSSGANVVASTSVHFSTWQRTDVTDNPYYTEHGNGIFDAELGYQAPMHRWTVMGYVRNIGDKLSYNSIKSLGFSPALTGTENYAGKINPPRTYGVRLSIPF
jgi:iron complex outermembrane receptor protein